MTERQNKALEIKGNHKIYLQETEDIFFNKRLTVVMDLDDPKVKLDEENIADVLCDHTPDWLYEILELFNAGEEMESAFTFNESNLSELKEICDIVHEV